jgi:hypothetical protein
MITQTLHELRRAAADLVWSPPARRVVWVRRWFWRLNNGHVSAFTLEVRPDNVAVITIDAPGEKMNTLKAEFGSRCGRSSQIRDNKPARRGVYFRKADNFIAGADINMIARCRAQEAEALARQGSRLWRRSTAVDSGDCRHPRRLPGRRSGAGAGLPWPGM